MDRRAVLSLGISTGSYGEFVANIAELARSKKSSYVCVANTHMVIEACKSETFRRAVNAADIVTPDGMPLVKFLRLFYGVRQDRVAGMDLMPSLIRAAEKEGLSVFFYGSSEEILGKIRERVQKEYPQLRVAGTLSPPFRPLSDAELAADVNAINSSGAHLVLVCLGCPKQEVWMAKHKGAVAGVMIGVGGAFPVFAGVQTRAPLLMQKLCLEWLYRLCQEPSRLWKRYLYTNSKFIFLAVIEYFRLKVMRTSHNNYQERT